MYVLFYTKILGMVVNAADFEFARVVETQA